VSQRQLAILVGGGPAPGINSVIASATIRAIVEGVEVIGVRDGFERIMAGDASHVMRGCPRPNSARRSSI